MGPTDESEGRRPERLTKVTVTTMQKSTVLTPDEPVGSYT